MDEITLNEFRQIKGFVKADIEREIQLAKVSDTFLCYVLDFLGINRGGGNMMAVLTLLEYTEFVGHTYAQLKHIDKYDPFVLGFNQLIPSEYKKLPKDPSEVHKIIRNSLIFPTKNSPDVGVGMLDNNFGEKYATNAGITIKDGIWYFCVEKYYKDLMDVFNELEKQLIQSSYDAAKSPKVIQIMDPEN
jgi:hypothetical protein